MKRRSFLRSALAAAGLGTAPGCLRDLRFRDEKSHEPKVTATSVEHARRVDELTKRIVDQNTFTGLDPIVRVISVPEAVLFHRGSAELFISEGLVKKCKTDAELAAVLCTELGRMMAQKRAAIAVGRNPDPIPEIALPGGTSDANLVREAELAMQKRREDAKLAAEQSDEVQLAKSLLKGAGFDPAEFERVQGMVKQSDRGEAIKKQMAGTAPAPVWNR